MKTFSTLLWILSIQVGFLLAQPSGLALKEAQQLYEASLNNDNAKEVATNLKKAKGIYLEAVQSSPDHAYLHYNLGTILLKLKDFGPSIYHLQQAYNLNGDDQRIVGNLQRARLLAGIKGQKEEEAQLSQVFTSTWSELSPKLLQSIAILFGLLCTFGLLKKGLGPFAVNLIASLLICSVFIFLANARANSQWTPKMAVLLEKENPRSGLGLSYPGLLKDDFLKPGSSGKIIREEQGWIQVLWEQGPRGWVESHKIGIVK